MFHPLAMSLNERNRSYVIFGENRNTDAKRACFVLRVQIAAFDVQNAASEKRRPALIYAPKIPTKLG